MSYLRFDKTLMTNLEESLQRENPPDEQSRSLSLYDDC